MRVVFLILGIPGLVLTARPVAGQVADYYRGTVVNDDVTGQPAELELFIYARTDSGTIGWMKVGKPLGGSGATAVVARDLDSLYFVTVTTTGDTLIWASSRRTGALEGRYWIKGANYDGQAGRWRLVPQPRISRAALLLFAVCVGVLCVLGLAALTAARHQRWWAWRAKNLSLSAYDRRKLGGVQGWLAWIVLGQSLVAIYLLVTVRDTLDLLGGTWMLGATIDGMRPVLFFEAAGHFFQLLGILLGLVLIWRHSRLAPMYWVSMLALTAVYAIVDISAGSGLVEALTRMFGQGAGEIPRGMQEANTQNGRMILNAAIWSLYWVRSRRVFVVFGPAPAAPSVSDAEASFPSRVDALQLPSTAGWPRSTMPAVFSPAHRTWLIRGTGAIAVMATIATLLAIRGDAPPAIQASGETSNARHAATVSEIAEIARRATVQVVAMDRRGEAIGQGTGFFVSSDGLIATNYHVIEGARALRVQTLDGTPLSEVYLVGTDTARDLAMLRIQRLSGSFLRVATRDTPATGDPVYVMGNPLGQVGTFSTGVVSSTRELRDRELIQITAPISPGSSGGPVLNGAGEVIGVATLNLRDGQNMNFAVSARYLPTMMTEKDNAVLFAEAARGAAEPRERRGSGAAQSGSENTERSAETFNADIDPQFFIADSIVQSIGYVPESRIVRDYLEAGKMNRHPVNLDRAGTYLIQAYCDLDCSQLALSIRDVEDSVIDTDQGATDHPMLAFVADAPGRYIMRIAMLSCNVSPCAYGIRLYRATRRRSH